MEKPQEWTFKLLPTNFSDSKSMEKGQSSSAETRKSPRITKMLSAQYHFSVTYTSYSVLFCSVCLSSICYSKNTINVILISTNNLVKGCFERNGISRKGLIVETSLLRHFKEHFLSFEMSRPHVQFSFWFFSVEGIFPKFTLLS